MPRIETFTCGGCNSVYTPEQIWFIASSGGNCVISSLFVGATPGLLIVDPQRQMLVEVTNVEYFCSKKCLKKYFEKRIDEIMDGYVEATLGELVTDSKPS
jgi:hypothetical protein